MGSRSSGLRRLEKHVGQPVGWWARGPGVRGAKRLAAGLRLLPAQEAPALRCGVAPHFPAWPVAPRAAGSTPQVSGDWAAEVQGRGQLSGPCRHRGPALAPLPNTLGEARIFRNSQPLPIAPSAENCPEIL